MSQASQASTAVELTPNAIKVLEARYLRRDSQGNIVETPVELFRRVARAVAAAEQTFGASGSAAWEESFFDMLTRLEFLPNSPTLMNAGAPLGQLSACFVLPVGDSMEEIFDSLKRMALIQQSGGGTGFSFSHLRPRGDPVASTGGRASGPVSFMRIFDAATESLLQGGKRRGANMGILSVDHPDIEEFVDAKADGTDFSNFNLSIAVNDRFMRAVETGESFALHHPRTHAPAKRVRASELFARISRAAWQSGDPGLVFVDTINRANPLPSLGPIEATNPCGEVPLLPYEACTLGSVNVARLVRRRGKAHEIDWHRLDEVVALGVRFLDDVVEACRWPLAQVATVTRANRKIGLGVMGFAELLLLLEVPYGSPEAARIADELMTVISERALAASRRLARERGPFPNWRYSVHAHGGHELRNATHTSIAPTGTISIIAGTSAGIEPLFALAYRRSHVLGDERLVELNPLFVRHAKEHGFYSESVVHALASKGSLHAVAGVPQASRSLFRTALELTPEEHLAVQAAFQKHVDNAVSKTINLAVETGADDIERIYQRAWSLGLKGVTVYRYGSKTRQVLELGVGESAEEREHFVRCEPQTCKL